MDCFYCKKDERQAALMLPLAALKWSDVYLFRDQKHRGRCIVALKEHRDELWQLSEEQRAGFFAEVSAVAEAVSRYAQADKINYAIYGDLVSHFHVHLVPKRKGELQWGGPFTDDIEKKLLTEEEYREIGEAILAQLQEICTRKQLPLVPHRGEQ
jgi:diadenosine tetraphosphate (Ap4A) HIT family hydrolase